MLVKNEVLCTASIHTNWVYKIGLVKKWSITYGLYLYHLGLQHKVFLKSEVLRTASIYP